MLRLLVLVTLVPLTVQVRDPDVVQSTVIVYSVEAVTATPVVVQLEFVPSPEQHSQSVVFPVPEVSYPTATKSIVEAVVLDVFVANAESDDSARPT